MFAAERCTGRSPKQIWLKMNSALYSKQLAEESAQVSSTGFSSKAPELQSLKAESQLGSFYNEDSVLHGSLMTSGI